ncbi:Fe-S cluster assembly protein SufD [Hyphococcus flavus]|uniref:Fe-S cluster assembly protein SufD n=1 Tax=Hyphococcus flavus TaxID=1866326 RepID=A0AAE9ZBP7_9PROT|nr:Fe-S cluster assembly protein SufD [Hyphococcus flavus]WDI31714.1 Fe-S cluster assembly protein SufD [Hyphococcus flavus]
MAQTAIQNPSVFEAALEAAYNTRSKTGEAQAAAFDRYVKLRLPNRKVEGWKWSDFNNVLRSFEPANDVLDTTVAPSAFAGLDPLEFRIVDGRIELPAEDMPEGLRYGVMDTVATIPELENHAIATLNVAMTRKALGVEVREGVEFDRPILVRHINTGAGFSFAQTMIRFSENSRATLIETYEGEGAGFYSHLFHTVLRDGAQIKRYVLQNAGEQSISHAICAAKIDEQARLEQTSLSTGGRLSRHENHFHFWALDSSAMVNSASLLADARHADFTSDIRHFAGSCQARQLHKGVAKDLGRNVFQGKFYVKREAQKTDAQMTANALLLSDTAEANHKPELEIYADDVECAHGSTVGALDEDALFYLRQRGLDEEQARALLVEAFVGEIVERIDNDGVRDIFALRVKEWLDE